VPYNNNNNNNNAFIVEFIRIAVQHYTQFNTLFPERRTFIISTVSFLHFLYYNLLFSFTSHLRLVLFKYYTMFSVCVLFVQLAFYLPIHHSY
jgi:hypothetical protein